MLFARLRNSQTLSKFAMIVNNFADVYVYMNIFSQIGMPTNHLYTTTAVEQVGLHPRAIRELSSNASIVIEEADKGGAITIINKEDHIHHCNQILTVNSTCQKTTSDMMETHNEEAMDIIRNMSPNNWIHISKLIPVKATPGTFYTLPKLHKHNHLISTKTNTHSKDGNLISTTQLIDKATSLSIRPHTDL